MLSPRTATQPPSNGCTAKQPPCSTDTPAESPADPPPSHQRPLGPAQPQAADEAATYLTNKAPYLDYPTALNHGWPIATGIIEGACRHLIKDRMDITGARWGLAGAEAILKLRAIKPTATSTPTGAIHLDQERHHVHEARYHDHLIPKAA